MCDVVEQIYIFKNVKGMGIISLSEAEWHLVPPIFCLFVSLIHKKTAFKAISVEQVQMDTFHQAKLQYWNSCELSFRVPYGDQG